MSIRLTIPDQLLNGEFRIFNITDRVIKLGMVSNKGMDMNLNNLASGLYSISIVKDKYTSTERLVITE